MTSADDPFHSAAFAKLGRFRFRAGAVLAGRPGETPLRGVPQGSGLEVESFKEYTPGDDIRHVDWIALARLDQLLTRRFVAEREISVHVLLDTSASMDAPRGEGKLSHAMRLAASLAWIALSHNDSIRLATFSEVSENGLVVSRLLRHRGRFGEVREFLSGSRPGGVTRLSDGVRRYVERHTPRGLLFLISDLLVPEEEIRTALETVRCSRLSSHVFHAFAPSERTGPPGRGALALHDSETGGIRRVWLDDRVRERLRRGFDRRVERVRALCHAAGTGYSPAPSSEDVDRVLAESLVRSGVLGIV